MTLIMLATIIISVLTCITMIGFILFKPQFYIKKFSVGSYWIITIIGAIILICCGFIRLDSIWESMTANTAINPLKILVIFISMTILSVFLDELGFFKYMANIALKKSGNNQFKLFVYLYLVVSLLTVFTSNDIIVLTFTPFICVFCKNAKINPVPYLVAEFVAANTWSMFLIVGNPTNIYLATSLNIDFLTYVSHMALPTLFAGISSFIILILIFKKSLSNKISEAIVENVQIKEKTLLWIGLIHLLICIIGLAISSYIKVEMWIIALFCSSSLLIIVLFYRIIKKEKPEIIIKSLKRAPWELIPFVLSMFVIVLALDGQGVTAKMYDLLNIGNDEFVYGITSALIANVLNNIPMSVLYSSIIENGASLNAIFGAIIGSNIGAFITPVGALAGIMWSNILRKYQVDFNHRRFVGYGVSVGIPTILFACAGLLLIS